MKNGGNVKWSLRRVRPGLWQGEVRVDKLHPRAVMPLRKVALAPSKAGALQQAAAQVAAVASNPVLRAVMPPGTSNAIAAVGLLATAAKRGKLGAVARKLSGTGARRLAKALGGWF